MREEIFMIANELNRLLNGIKNNQDTEELTSCIERLFELIDLTINCQPYRYKKELLRFRDLIAEQYLNNPKNQKEISGLYKILLLMNPETAELYQKTE